MTQMAPINWLMFFIMFYIIMNLTFFNFNKSMKTMMIKKI